MEFVMSKCCFVTGKKTLFGNNVSHSNRKTRRKFFSNLHKMKFWFHSQNKFIRLVVSKKGLKIINKFGIDFVIKKKKMGVLKSLWQKKTNV